MSNQLGHLDAIDTKIIQLLAQNSRMSFVDIGKEVNLSRVAVKLRIQALEENGVIEKYSVIINPEKLGNSLAVFLDIQVRPDSFNDTCDLLKEKPEIIKIYQMTGNTRLHVHAMLESNRKLEHFLKNEVYSLPGLLQVECNMIMSRIKDNEEIKI